MNVLIMHLGHKSFHHSRSSVGNEKRRNVSASELLEHIVIKASQVCVYSLAAGVTLIGSLFLPQVTQPVALSLSFFFIPFLGQPLILCLNTLLFAFAASLARSMTLFFSRPQAHTNMLTHTHTHTLALFPLEAICLNRWSFRFKTGSAGEVEGGREKLTITGGRR